MLHAVTPHLIQVDIIAVGSCKNQYRSNLINVSLQQPYPHNITELHLSGGFKRIPDELHFLFRCGEALCTILQFCGRMLTVIMGGRNCFPRSPQNGSQIVVSRLQTRGCYVSQKKELGYYVFKHKPTRQRRMWEGFSQCYWVYLCFQHPQRFPNLSLSFYLIIP